MAAGRRTIAKPTGRRVDTRGERALARTSTRAMARQGPGGRSRPIGRPRRSEQGEVSTRDLILGAASEAFAARGYCGVNLTDVVEGLGYTKGALYFYFPTKEAVAAEIVDHYFSAFDAIADQVQKAPGARLDALVALCRQVAELLRGDPVARAGARLATERNLIDAELPEPFGAWMDKAGALLRAAKRAKELSANAEPRQIAQLVVANFHGTHVVGAHLSARFDAVQQLDQFFAVLLPAIRA